MAKKVRRKRSKEERQKRYLSDWQRWLTPEPYPTSEYERGLAGLQRLFARAEAILTGFEERHRETIPEFPFMPSAHAGAEMHA